MKEFFARAPLRQEEGRVVVDAGPAARDLVRGAVEQRRGERDRRGRIADPHLTQADDVHAVVDELVGHARAHGEGPQGVARRHRGAPGEVGRPRPDPPVDDAVGGADMGCRYLRRIGEPIA